MVSRSSRQGRAWKRWITLSAWAGVVAVLVGCPAQGARLYLLMYIFQILLVTVFFSGPPGTPAPKQADGIAHPGRAVYVAAAAHSAGANATTWRTDVEILNLGSEGVVSTVELLEPGRDNSSPESVEVMVEGGACLRLGDVLAEQYGFTGAAALRFTPADSPIMVTSRTYNLLGDGNPMGLPAGATFGQFIPAVTTATAIAAGGEGRIIQLAHDRSGSSGARTNMILVNATGVQVVVDLDLFTAGGDHLGRVSTTLAPFEYHQLNRVFEQVTDGSVPLGHAVATTATPGGRFFVLASVVDNLTGDPIAVLPAHRAGPGEALYLQAAAHLRGAADTDWRTDVVVHNPGAVPATFTIELLVHGQANPSPEARTFALGAGESVRYGDVLDAVFSFSGKAALRLVASSGEIQVSSRTYNLLGDGNALGLPSGATFGQYIAAVTSDRSITAGVPGYLIQLSHDPTGNGGSRTNLGLVNATSEPVTVAISLHSGDGTLLGTVTTTLGPFEYLQHNRIFEQVTAAAVTDGYAVVSTTSGGARFFAQASVVDNLTGDPVAMTAVAMPPDQSAEAGGVLAGASMALGLLGNAAADGNDLTDLADVLLAQGTGPVFDQMVAADPDLLTRTADGVAADYGEGVEVAPGVVVAGTSRLHASGLAKDGGSITGTLTEEYGDLTVNGSPVWLDSITWAADLQVAGDGSVVGDLTLTSEPPVTRWLAKLLQLPSVEGSLHIDTTICLTYPVSGSFTVQVAGRTVEIVLSEDCSGAYAASADSQVEFGVYQREVHIFEPYLLWTTSSTGTISGTGQLSQTTGSWGGLDSGITIRGDNRSSPIVISGSTDGWPETMVHREDSPDGSYETWTYTREGIVVGYPPLQPGSDYTIIIPAGEEYWSSVTVAVVYSYDHDNYEADGTWTGAGHGSTHAGRLHFSFEQAPPP